MHSLLICQNPDRDTLPGTVALCMRYELGIEMSDFSNLITLDDPNSVQQYARHIDSITLRTLHGPYLDLAPGSPNPAVRKATQYRFEQAYQAAVRLRARHLVLHPVYDPRSGTPVEWIQRSLSFWQNFLRNKPGSVRIHLENVMDAGPELLLELVKAVNRPDLDINLDIGHVHAYSSTPLIRWITILGSTIGYVHLHDNHGREDEHLGLGEGNLPIEKALTSLLKYAPQAAWSIESFGPGALQSIQWLHSHGFLKH